MHPGQDHIKGVAMEEPVEAAGAVEEGAAERVGLMSEMVNAINNMITSPSRCP